MRKTIFAAAVCLLATGGCVQHQWAPGPGTDPATFGRASGQCKLAGMGAHRGTFAYGSAAYVGTAMLAGAIGNAVRSQNVFNACMEASGFVVADAPARQ